MLQWTRPAFEKFHVACHHGCGISGNREGRPLAEWNGVLRAWGLCMWVYIVTATLKPLPENPSIVLQVLCIRCAERRNC